MEGVNELAPFIGHGGVVALALLVWWELRAYRKDIGKELAEHRKEEAESRVAWSKAVSVIDRLAKRLDDEETIAKAAKAARDAASAVADRIRDEISGVHEAISPEDITPRVNPMGGYSKHKRPRTNPGGGG